MSSGFIQAPPAISPDNLILLNFSAAGMTVDVLLQAGYTLCRLGVPEVLLYLAITPDTDELSGSNLCHLGRWRSSFCALRQDYLRRGRPE